jgi:hypothetical protein
MEVVVSTITKLFVACFSFKGDFPTWWLAGFYTYTI